MVDCSSRSKSLGGMLAKENVAGERRTNEDWQSHVREGKLALRSVIHFTGEDNSNTKCLNLI